MKKFLSAILAAAMFCTAGLTLAACDKGGNGGSGSSGGELVMWYTVKEYGDLTLETKNLSKLTQYVYFNAIDIAEGFVGDDDCAYYFKRLIKAVLNILKDKAGIKGLSRTYEDGPLAVTREMRVGIDGPDDDPELPFLKKFHSALQASKLAWMFDSSMPTPAEIAEFVGKEDE